ncbi:cytokinin hydroxylase-like [Rosa rugosa]|uniref:cytokinin hydroxylase-like n=1 Tax=Rosa rugosa TaxID=74645 RepID=UPI002B411F0C|nr:cytokinin hydroxylase-like [Rosa rugosa]
MEFIGFLTMAVFIVVVLYLLCRLLLSCWVFPVLTYRKLKKNGLTGPSPSFPLGNLSEMKKKTSQSSSSSSFGPSSNSVTHDIHSTLFPYFARWQKAYGKMFVYWLGTEPFLYVADAALLKKLSSEVTAKNWGKPAVFRRDRAPMFGNGLVMSEGDDWVRHRHVITPAFNPTNLKAMASLMVETATTMLDNWATQINTSGIQEIDVEDSITATAGEIIAKTSFGISYHSGRLVFEKLRALQMTLFKTTRFVGVPFGKFIYPMKTLEAGRLGEEINQLFLSIIAARKKSIRSESPQHDLLGMLLKESDKPGNFSRSLTTQELVDECKTFFFGGHETTALAITWTMLLLATHTDWQDQLRAEIKEVVGDKEIDVNNLAGLKKMGWVMNEVLRLYPSAPNAQRQAKDDIQVSEDLTIPKGTNMWIDTVGMHHDPELWGEDVHEFKPERFKDDIHGGCKHKMGYLPFGFGGRMCIGRNLTFLEYKIVLTLILSRFSFTVSPTYTHAPSIALSLRPSNGLPLVLQPLN